MSYNHEDIKPGYMVELASDPGVLWEAVHWDFESSDQQWRLKVRHHGSTAVLYIHPDNIARVEDNDSWSKRQKCFELIRQIPESGLDEAVESLGDMIEHWTAVDKVRANPPEWEETTRVVQATVRTIKLKETSNED